MPSKRKKKPDRTYRTRALFDTGTKPHASPKDYTRKVKYKRKLDKDDENT